MLKKALLSTLVAGVGVALACLYGPRQMSPRDQRCGQRQWH